MQLEKITNQVYNRYKNTSIMKLDLTEDQKKKSINSYLRHRNSKLREMSKILRLNSNEVVKHMINKYREKMKNTNSGIINTLFPGMREHLKSRETLEMVKRNSQRFREEQRRKMRMKNIMHEIKKYRKNY